MFFVVYKYGSITLMEENTLSSKQKSMIVGGFVIVLLVGVYLLFVRGNAKNTENSVENSSASTTNITLGTGTTTKNGYTIEEVSVESRPVPDLNRQLTVYTNAIVAPEARTFAMKKVAEIQTTLKKDTRNISKWIDLGIYQKSGGDYEGALLSWKYANYLSPNDYVSLGNIANLYAYFIKNNTEAEKYYKEAIAVGSTQSYLYIQFAEMYRDIVKDASKAKAVIEQGLKNIPNNQDLLGFKASLN